MALGLGLGLQFKNGLKAQPFNGLFDQFGYPAFGASIRLLGINYTGGLVRVRAFDGLADQGTADVMPYKIGSEFWVDLNSTLENLDATAISRGLTTSDTLGDLLSSGVNDYDGFVTTWFDQSGNANDATQATAASQPQIASAGSLILENGKPATSFSNDLLRRIRLLTTNNWGIFAVVKNDLLVGGTALLGQHNGSAIIDRVNFMQFLANSYEVFFNNGTSYSGSHSTAMTTNQTLLGSFAGSNNYSLAINGDLEQVITGQSFTPLDTQFNIGALGDGANPFNGKIQEIVVYNTSKSEDRTGIESEINNAFTIY